MNTDTNEVTLNPSSTARALGLVAFLFVLASIGSRWVRTFRYAYRIPDELFELFNLDSERNLPAFFSLMLLLVAAGLLATIARLDRKHPERVSKWVVLSCGFLYMAYDEAFSIHEMLNDPFRELLGNGRLGVFYYAWVIPAMALVFGLALYFGRFLIRLPAHTRKAFVMAAVVYIGGAIGVELLGGRQAEMHGTRNLVYVVFVTVEESLEMAGVILFIHGLLAYIAEHHKRVDFCFVNDPAKEPDVRSANIPAGAPPVAVGHLPFLRP